MQRTIIKSSIFHVYAGDGPNMVFLGEYTVEGRKATISKKEMETEIKTRWGDATMAVFHHYETELREISDEDFLKHSHVVEK